MTFPQAVSSRKRQLTSGGDLQSTDTLDGSTTTEIVRLSTVAEKVTFQSTGDLAGDVTFSLNGTDFASSTAFTAGALVTFSAHLVKSVTVVRSGGSGRLIIAAK